MHRLARVERLVDNFSAVSPAETVWTLDRLLRNARSEDAALLKRYSAIVWESRRLAKRLVATQKGLFTVK
jgi:hypothetical protein